MAKAGRTSSKKKPASRRAASTKKTTKKPAAKKSTTKKKTTKKSVTKKPAAKKTTKKVSAKKTSKKVTKKPAAKKTTKKAPAKKVAKKPVTKKPAAKTSKKVAKKPVVKVSRKPAERPQIASKTSKKPAKGITIVKPKSTNRATKPKPKIEMPKSEPLLKPGGKWKPLIPSGPSAAKKEEETTAKDRKKVKKLTKRELDKYRDVLLHKRRELLGDLNNIEKEALSSESGSLSHLPQHMAEQGSDSYDQSLSLDLAEQDRKLIREIDEALERIDAGTYGICEISGQRIRAERLEEIPWAKYSIEAARERERQMYFQ